MSAPEISVPGMRSKSGVFIADDFRSNLIIDRYDPVFADMRASKLKHLRSANSEDAVTWNVFRSLRQIAPEVWLPPLWTRAFPDLPQLTDHRISVKLWESVLPPRSLLPDGDEGASEIDVIIEADSWVWFVEAKYRSDVSRGTTTRPDRDQILRNLDVGTNYAGVRRFFFSLLITSKEMSPTGTQMIEDYRDFNLVRTKLFRHRPDGLGNLAGVGLVAWLQLAEVLHHAEQHASREDERAYAMRAASWLRERVLSPKPLVKGSSQP